MSEKRFALIDAIFLDVKAILTLVFYVEVHTFMLLKISDICLSRRMSYRYVDMPMLTYSISSSIFIQLCRRPSEI